MTKFHQKLLFLIALTTVVLTIDLFVLRLHSGHPVPPSIDGHAMRSAAH